MLVSSANKVGRETAFLEHDKSCMYKRKNSGPRSDPWGSPCLSLTHSEKQLVGYLLFIKILWYLFLLIQLALLCCVFLGYLRQYGHTAATTSGNNYAVARRHIPDGHFSLSERLRRTNLDENTKTSNLACARYLYKFIIKNQLVILLFYILYREHKWDAVPENKKFRLFLFIRSNEGLSRLLKLRPSVVQDVHGSEMISERLYCKVPNAIFHVCVGDRGTD